MAAQTGLRAALAASRNLIGWAVVFSAGVNLLYLAPSLFMLQIYDRVLTTGGILTLVLLFGVLAFALLVLGLLDVARQRLAARLGLRFNRLLAPTVIDLGLSRSTGNDTARAQAARDFDTLRQTLVSPAAFAVLDGPWTIVFVLACFMIHWVVGAVTLVGGLVLVLIAMRHEHALRPIIARTSELAPKFYAAQQTDRGASEAMNALGMRQALVDRQMAARQDFVATQTETLWTQSAYGSASKVWRLLLQSIVLGVGAWLAVERQISPGALIAGSILAARALAPIEQAIGGWRQIEQARLAYKNLYELIDNAPPAPERTTLPDPRGEVRFERVTVRVPDAQRLALRDVTFALQPGEVVGVVGPSGAGKSTLARVASGALAPDVGVVRLDGASLADWDIDARGRFVGYLPQDVSLFRGTIAENIRRFAPASDLADTLTIAAAQQAGAHEMILRLPLAYETPLGQRGAGLSLGQAQRIALARALYNSPPFLVLDEPNAHLDAEGEQALLKAIGEVRARGASVILVAHRSGVIAIADKLLVLRDGAIERFGPREEVARAMAQQAQQAGAVTPLRRGEGATP
jgi:ATP-binding cassette subfamily C protein